MAASGKKNATNQPTLHESASIVPSGRVFRAISHQSLEKPEFINKFSVWLVNGHRNERFRLFTRYEPRPENAFKCII